MTTIKTTKQEFHVRSPVGEDILLECPVCKYSSNAEMALGSLSPELYFKSPEELAKIPLHQLDPRSHAKTLGPEAAAELEQLIQRLLPEVVPRDIPLSCR